MTAQKIEYWVIPLKANGEFAASMEYVLDTYKMPHNLECPVVCMDEQPIQLLDHAWTPIPETKKHPKRIDYEYIRKGTASIFMFAEPLVGWRHVFAREHRTKQDWGEEVKKLLAFYPDAKKVILVCDNLNTHNYGSFYERYKAKEAFSISQRLDIRHTPKHGSWLNIAECELSVLTRQCLQHERYKTIDSLNKALSAWNIERNTQQKTVSWQFTTDDARIKLKSLYPLL